MAIAYDYYTAGTPGTGAISWTHTPAGTPRGVLVFVMQYNNATDQVTGVTYGGVTMTELTGSPLLKATGETGAVYAYFLGADVPTGNQTVAVSVNATGTNKSAVCFTVTGSDTIAIQESDATITSDSVSNPSTTLALGGLNGWCAIGFVSGVVNVAGITPLTDWTGSYEYDDGAGQHGSYRYNTVGTTDVTAGWTQGADDAIAIAVALKEATLIISKSEGVTLGETNAASLPDALTLSKSEGLTVGESSSVTVESGAQPDRNVNISTEPTITLGESRTVTLSDLAINKTDGLTLGESNSGALSDLILSKSEGLTVGESNTQALVDISTSVTDGLTIADLLPGRYTDDIRLGETVNVAIGAIEDLAITASDGVTLGEASTISLNNLTIAQSEGMTVGESSAAVLPDALAVSQSEGITLGESVNAEIESVPVQTINVSDGLTLGEAAAVILPDNLVITQSEGVTLGEIANAIVEAEGELYVTASDGVTLGESSAASIANALSISQSEGVTIADTPSVAVSSTADFSVNVTDGVTLGETKNASIPDSLTLSVTDGVTIGESYSIVIPDVLVISKSENLTIGESSSVGAISIEISVSEGMTLADVASVVMLDALVISATDGLTVGESAFTWIEGQATGIINLEVDKRLADAHIMARGSGSVDSRSTGLHIRNSGHG